MSHLGKSKIAARAIATSLVIAGTIMGTSQGMAMENPDPPQTDSVRLSTTDVVVQNEEADFETLKLAADKEDREAQYKLGTMHYHRECVECSDIEAIKYYKLAADQGHAGAQRFLTQEFLYGEKTVENYDESFRYIKSSADHGYINAQMLLGNVYYNGLYNVMKDYSLALGYFRLAADNGATDAQLRVSQMYEHGLGVGKDAAESEKFLHAYIKDLVVFDSDELENFTRIAAPLCKSLQDTDAYPILSALKDIPAEKRETIVNFVLPWINDIRTGERRACLLRHLSEFKSPDLDISLPSPGIDAYWAHNPNNTIQKILLVPSMHTHNFRDVRLDLGKEIKSSQVLIVENVAMKESTSWDDECIIRSFCPNLQELKKHKLINHDAFLLADRPWTSCLSLSSVEFLRNNFEPILHPLLEEFRKKNKSCFLNILNKFPIDHINPTVVLAALKATEGSRRKITGMDSHILKHFDLDDKKYIYGLETDLEAANMTKHDREEVLKFHRESYVILKETIDFCEFKNNGLNTIATTFETTINNIQKLDIPKIVRDECHVNHPIMCAHRLMKLQEAISTSKYGIVSEREDTYRRNQMWAPRLIEKFNENKDYSIVVVVGAYHFVDKFGILNLLAEQGFTFTKF